MSAAESCRSCGSERIEVFLQLGELPLPDALLTEEQLAAPEPRYPLDVAFCAACSLVQVLEEVPPETLFVDNYLYFSSFSDSLVAHARKHALALAETRGLGPESLVVEIASNDGYGLRHFVELGIPVLGIDPAPAQADAAEAAGVPTLREFFGPEVARRLRDEGRRADVVIANNVLAHTPDPNGFVEALAILLAEDGVATIENTWVHDLVTRREFDTIYHEHFSYYSCHAIARLLARHGLYLNRVEHFPELQGGSLRWSTGHAADPDESVRSHLETEHRAGVLEADYYRSFAGAVGQVRERLAAMLSELRADGRTIAAYGAAAKGSTLLNHCGIGRELIDFVVDRNPHKHGLYMPGVHLPVRPVEALLDEQPDVLLLLAWNLRDEILAQQAEYRRRGGRFLVPVPEPELL